MVVEHRIALDCLHAAKTASLVQMKVVDCPCELSHLAAVVHDGSLVPAESPCLNRVVMLAGRDNLGQMERHPGSEIADRVSDRHENDLRANVRYGCLHCVSGCGPAFQSRNRVGIRPSVGSDMYGHTGADKQSAR